MRQLMKWHFYIVHILAALTGLCVVFLIVAIGAEAIIRSLGFGYIPGVIDISEFSLFFIAVLASPWLLRDNQHIRVDIVIAQFPPRLRAQAEKLIYLVVLSVAGVILYYSCKVFMESWRLEELVIREVEIPDWWLQWQIPLAMLLICIDLIQRLFFPHCRYEPKRKSWLDVNGPTKAQTPLDGDQ